MKIDILTLFPEMFEPLKASMIGRALENNLFELNLINIRDFSKDKHMKVDDYVFGCDSGSEDWRDFFTGYSDELDEMVAKAEYPSDNRYSRWCRIGNTHKIKEKNNGSKILNRTF